MLREDTRVSARGDIRACVVLMGDGMIGRLEMILEHVLCCVDGLWYDWLLSHLSAVRQESRWIGERVAR